MRAVMLTRVYASPDLHFNARRPADSRHLVPIPPGTVGEVVSQIIHPYMGIVITTVQFDDLYADVGDTVWEPVE